MGTYMKSFAGFLSNLLVALLVLLAIALVGVRLVGFKTYTVISASMEPTYMTGSLLYVKDVDPADLKKNDVITFLLNEDTVATHRIVEIVDKDGELNFRTKGDKNESVDGGLVHYRNVIGKPVFSIPYLGYLAYYIQRPPGIYLFGLFIVLAVLTTLVSSLLKE